jgi:hypothetical protein
VDVHGAVVKVDVHGALGVVVDYFVDHAHIGGADETSVALPVVGDDPPDLPVPGSVSFSARLAGTALACPVDALGTADVS